MNKEKYYNENSKVNLLKDWKKKNFVINLTLKDQLRINKVTLNYDLKRKWYKRYENTLRYIGNKG